VADQDRLGPEPAVPRKFRIAFTNRRAARADWRPHEESVAGQPDDRHPSRVVKSEHCHIGSVSNPYLVTELGQHGRSIAMIADGDDASKKTIQMRPTSQDPRRIRTHRSGDRVMAKKMIRLIRSENDHDEDLEEIEHYFESKPRPGTLEADRFDLLALTIEDYERTRWPVDPPEGPPSVYRRANQCAICIQHAHSDCQKRPKSCAPKNSFREPIQTDHPVWPRHDKYSCFFFSETAH
jgi:hypothetical protein